MKRWPPGLSSAWRGEHVLFLPSTGESQHCVAVVAVVVPGWVKGTLGYSKGSRESLVFLQ